LEAALQGGGRWCYDARMNGRTWILLALVVGLLVVALWLLREVPSTPSGSAQAEEGAPAVETSASLQPPTPPREGSTQPATEAAPSGEAPVALPPRPEPTEGVPVPSPSPAEPAPATPVPSPPPPETFGAVLTPEDRLPEEEDLIPKSTWPVTADGIRNAIGEQIPELLECYEAWVQAHPGLSGRMLARFRIEPTHRAELARITGVRLGRSTVNHRLLEGCVLNVLSSLRFDSPESGAVTVSYPLVFNEGETSPGGSR
jgi:outer membrane biosynthesis protein TonB